MTERFDISGPEEEAEDEGLPECLIAEALGATQTVVHILTALLATGDLDPKIISKQMERAIYLLTQSLCILDSEDVECEGCEDCDEDFDVDINTTGDTPV